MKLTDNFWLEEFGCKDGTPVPQHLMTNVQKLADNLQVLRNTIHEPIFINSAYRTVEHNSKIGGSMRSQHLFAKAADIKVGEGFTPNIIYQLIEELIRDGLMTEGGLGLYDTFVHYDVRGYKARW